MLGFDAVGKLALGQLPGATSGAVQTPTVYSRWPDVAKKGGLTAAVIATTFAGFVPPPPAQAKPSFAEFSRPHAKAHQADSWGFVAPPQTQPPALFSSFDQRTLDRVFVDEQSSFAVLPPPAPFTGFASFERPLRARRVIVDFQDWWIAPLPPADTHDGVFVKKKRKGKKYDPAADELDIRAKRRGAIYDALVPKVEYSLPDLILPPRAVPPPNVEDLAQMVMAARQQAEMEARQREIEADDDDLEMILKDIL